MSGIRKWLAKDRYGIVRGSILLLVLLLLCAVLVVAMLNDVGQRSVEERAMDTADRIAAQFEERMRCAFIDLDGAAALVAEDPSRENMFLDALYEYSPYTEVGVLSDGIIRHRDGSINNIRHEIAYRYNVENVPGGHIVALFDGSVLLCATIEEGREIAARYDTDALDQILGSSFEEDYDFAVYSATTGSYLVNHTVFTKTSYYDALLSLNRGGSTSKLLKEEAAIALVENYGDGVYIAQQPSDVRPWNVALVIPRSAVQDFMWEQSKLLFVLLSALLLLILTYILFVCLVRRSLRADQRELERTLEDRARMLNDMAHEAQVTLFIYHRGQDDLMNCYDGLGLLGDDSVHGRRLTSLTALETACGFNEADTDRLHQHLSEMQRGESVKLTLRGALPDREERMLCFDLKAHAENGEVIVCSVRDCTQELLSQNRAEIEKNYLENTLQRTVAVWTINVSRNLWRNVYMKDPEQMGSLRPLRGSGWRDFTADLTSVLRDYIYPPDYEDNVQRMSIPAIAECFRSGKVEFDSDYRIRATGEGDYVWHRMHVRIYAEPESGDILAYIYVFDVDVEKKAELERRERKRIFERTLRALSGIYFALYYVDLDNDLCYAAKSYDGELVTKLSAPYRETFDDYLAGVHPEDRDELRSMLDAFSIRRAFTENTRFVRKAYRRRSGDAYRWAALIIQPARYENGRIKDVVIAMRHLSSQKHELDLE